MKELPDRILAQSLDPEGVDLDILTGSIEPGEWTKGDYKELFRIGGEIHALLPETPTIENWRPRISLGTVEQMMDGAEPELSGDEKGLLRDLLEKGRGPYNWMARERSGWHQLEIAPRKDPWDTGFQPNRFP